MECICWGNADSYVAAGTRKGNVFLYNQLTKQTFAAFTMKPTSKVLASSLCAHSCLRIVTSVGVDFVDKMVAAQRSDRHDIVRRVPLVVELSSQRIDSLDSLSQGARH
jgi:hypothetical protein